MGPGPKQALRRTAARRPARGPGWAVISLPRCVAVVLGAAAPSPVPLESRHGAGRLGKLPGAGLSRAAESLPRAPAPRRKCDPPRAARGPSLSLAPAGLTQQRAGPPARPAEGCPAARGWAGGLQAARERGLRKPGREPRAGEPSAQGLIPWARKGRARPGPQKLRAEGSPIEESEVRTASTLGSRACLVLHSCARTPTARSEHSPTPEVLQFRAWLPPGGSMGLEGLTGGGVGRGWGICAAGPQPRRVSTQSAGSLLFRAGETGIASGVRSRVPDQPSSPRGVTQCAAAQEAGSPVTRSRPALP